MTEQEHPRHDKPEWRRFDTVRNIIDLGKVAAAEVIRKVGDKIDDRFYNTLPEDDPEDQTLTSDIWNRKNDREA